MKVRVAPERADTVADSLSRSPVEIDWKDFQKLPAPDDPYTGITIASFLRSVLLTHQNQTPWLTYLFPRLLNLQTTIGATVP